MATVLLLQDIFAMDVFPNDHFLINPVNCVGVMGAGLAREFKERYPDMFNEYRKACENKTLRPGTLHGWKIPGTMRTIINFPTKNHWKDDSSLDLIKRSLDVLVHMCYAYCTSCTRYGLTVDIPKIGCGCGKLSWEDVRPMIVHTFQSVPCILRIPT